jgi:ATP-dependent helicase/nuclease subunit A
VESILSLFDLKGAQRNAAEQLAVNLAVTAGAGSGKTRTLAARYLRFVEQGVPLRALIAITFTEKAAREMRSRIRHNIEKWLTASASTIAPHPIPLPAGERGSAPLPLVGGGAGGEGGIWQRAFTDLDSARIGTIHSLCADFLRQYPAEARIDPHFAVLEEGQAATLQAQAVETTLAWAADDPQAVQLFSKFKESDLRRIVSAFVANRLEVDHALAASDPLARWEEALERWLARQLAAPAWAEAIATLAEYAARSAEDKLDLARREVLTHWSAAQSACAARDWNAAGEALRQLNGAINLRGGQKGNWDSHALESVRAAMRALRSVYEEYLELLFPKDGCRWELDQQVARLLPVFRRLFERAGQEYQALKDDRRALDFDDLEGLTSRLLTTRPEVAHEISAGLRAVLVDEFQDTNDRQRQIVYALTGFGEKEREMEKELVNLFIVGDEKQSIYRFRGADVTVFRQIQNDIVYTGGQALDLNLTFRAHAPLLDLIRRLLTPLMGEADADPSTRLRQSSLGLPLYRVPFKPLSAYREAPSPKIRAPFVEFHLGVGDANAGRRAAALALAARLHQLHDDEGFKWEDIALLFRASTTFPIYENALEATGIPFVTVAGRGFYDRPEIRNLLNALAALADPTDDLALAGLLRSPAFGLTDADLYALRFPDGESPRPYYQSLITNPNFTPIAEIITHLHTLAGRLPVAELLKEFLDRTHYRAVLQAISGSARLTRNVDKLLSDAHRSGLTAVGDFLEYMHALRDVGAREGEAPADAVGDRGAVQLMTVHKAKGLEFPLVVIADAGYEHRGGGGPMLLDSELGALFRPTPTGARPFAWQLGALNDADRTEAEDQRLLYVATTRAEEKLIFSGATSISAAKSDPARLSLSGWLRPLGEVMELDQIRLSETALTAPCEVKLPAHWAGAVRVTLHPPMDVAPSTIVRATSMLETPPQPGPLVTTRLVAAPSPLTSGADEAELPRQVWRVVSGQREVPAWVVDKIVHAALRRWLFPDGPDFDLRLRPVALGAGLTDEALVRQALSEARRLLECFQGGPLFAEMDAAERHHELAYVLSDDAGVIDLLYRSPEGWVVADFKTDEVRDEAQLPAVIRDKQYDVQLKRQADAVAAQLGERPRARLFFLNVSGAVCVAELETTPGSLPGPVGPL